MKNFRWYITAGWWSNSILAFLLLVCYGELFSQFSLSKTDFNLGTIHVSRAFIDIHLMNNSSETIYDVSHPFNPSFKATFLQPSLNPGETGVLRLECRRKTIKPFNEFIELHINGNESFIGIHLKGKFTNRWPGSNQNCPDFSKATKKRQHAIINNSGNGRQKVLFAMFEDQKENKSSKKLSADKYKPNNLVILIDASSSMKDGRKREFISLAFTELADILRPADQITVIAYANKTKLLLPPQREVPANKLMTIIQNIESEGYTNGSLGIRNAYLLADSIYDPEANNEIILATDGAFNANETNNISKDIISHFSERNIRLSILGIQNKSWAVREMRQLARNGNGRYMNVKSAGKAKKSLKKTIKIHSSK